MDYGEFVALSVQLKRMRINDEAHLHMAFEFFDKDGSGYIEAEELRGALVDELIVDAGNSSEEVIKGIMEEVDTNKVRVYECYFYLADIALYNWVGKHTLIYRMGG